MRAFCIPALLGSPRPPFRVTESSPIPENPRPTKFRIFFQVPYTLSSFFSHSSENRRGVGVFFPFRYSPTRVNPRRSAATSFNFQRLANCSKLSPHPGFLCFQLLTTVAICNSFVFMAFQQWGGCVPPPGAPTSSFTLSPGLFLLSTFCLLLSAFAALLGLPNSCTRFAAPYMIIRHAPRHLPLPSPPTLACNLQEAQSCIW